MGIMEIRTHRFYFIFVCQNNHESEEEQTTQWTKEKAQSDKQRSTKHSLKTKDRIKRTPLKGGG
jgi:hypothetical protein